MMHGLTNLKFKKKYIYINEEYEIVLSQYTLVVVVVVVVRRVCLDSW
jgi:hypothetical protein